MDSSRNQWFLKAVLVFFAVMVLYPLSYAPVVRVQRETWKPTAHPLSSSVVSFYVIDSSTSAVYKPVDWLIDETPLREPLLWWAEVCGVRGSFEFSALVRGPYLFRTR